MKLRNKEMFEIPENILQDFAEKVVERARKNLNTSGFGNQKRNRKKNSSGDLSKSLSYKIVKGVIFFTGNDYAVFVEEGRKAGSMPPINPIMEWIAQKPIRIQKTVKTQGIATKRFAPKTEKNIQSAAFAIAKNIQKKGIEPTPYFWDALEYTIDNLLPEYEQALASELENFFTDSFDKIEIK